MNVDENKLKIQHVSNEEIELWNSISQSVITGQSTKVTYDELVELMSNNKLKPNKQYVLTDYQTKYRQPVSNIIKESVIERLVLTAISESQISPVAASLDHSKDVVFYNVDDNVCEDSITPRNGFIQRRVDTANFIDIPYDWRTMLWARFKGTAPTWTSGTVTRRHIRQSGNSLYIVTRAGTPTSDTDPDFFQLLCSTNDYFFTGTVSHTGLTLNMEDYAERYTFNASTSMTLKSPTKNTAIRPENIVIESGGLSTSAIRELNNNVFMFSSVANRPTNTTFGSGCHSNTFGSGCHDNTFGSACYGNIFGSACYGNTFGSYCRDNIFANGCRDNTFGSACRNNTFGSDCRNNTFGGVCRENIFGSGCRSNIFGSACRENIFTSNCRFNNFGSDCHSNIFGSSCISNTFGCDCRNNTFGNNFHTNNIKSGVTNRNMSAITILNNNNSSFTIFRVGNSVVAHHYATATATTPTVTQIP